MKARRLFGLAVAVAAAIIIGGCGGSDSETASKATTDTTPARTAAASDGALTFGSTEFAFQPAKATAKAGKVKLTLVNHGKVQHELVLLKTEQDAGSLSVKDGRVSEAASVGEISETASGARKSTSLTVARGTYVFVCNIPGHYEDGMRGTLTVQ